MRRREILASVVAGFAGCSAGESRDPPTEVTPVDLTDTATPTESPTEALTPVVDRDALAGWPMSRSDAGHTGVGGGGGPELGDEPTISWEREARRGFPRSLLATDGVLFDQRGNGDVSLVDASSGETLRTDALPDDDHLMHGGALVDGVLYLGSSRYVTAIDAPTGRVVWQRPVGKSQTESDTTPIGGRATPAVSDDTVYVPGAVGSGWGLYALRHRDGETRWKAGTKNGSPITSPLVTDDSIYGVTRWVGELIAYNRANGDIRWSRSTTARQMSENNVADTEPVLHRDVLCVPTGDGSVVGFDPASGERRWRYETGASVPEHDSEDDTYLHVTFPLAARNGRVYLGDGDGSVHAIDVATGEGVWQTSLPERRYWTAPAVTEDAVYLGSCGTKTGPDGSPTIAWDGRLHAFDATDGTERWHLKRDGIVAAPVCGGGSLFASFVVERGPGRILRLE